MGRMQGSLAGGCKVHCCPRQGTGLALMSSTHVPTSVIPRKAVLIVNTHSRKGAKLFRRASERLTADGIELIAAYAIKHPPRLKDAVIEAVKGGAPMVIVGGGDGSLSSAVDH